MWYPVLLFVFAGFLGTLLALRLQAIDAQEYKSTLTRRGRIVVALLIGIAIAIFVVLVNGMWWNCNSISNACYFTWGY